MQDGHLQIFKKCTGSFEPPEISDEMTVITGHAPVFNMRDYQAEVTAYTKGRGRLAASLGGYEPCHNAEEVIAAADYDSERDLDNPTGSVFCAHGAGFVVPWQQVTSYMHLEGMKEKTDKKLLSEAFPKNTSSIGIADDKELEEIFQEHMGL